MKINKDFKGNKKPIAINSVIFIQNGTIIDNPFFNKLEKNIIIEWLFENNDKLIKKLKSYLKEYDSYNIGYNLENCYDFTLNYFLKNKEKIFNSSYFGDDTDYSIEQYVYSSLKYIVRNYIKSCNDNQTLSINTKFDDTSDSKFSISADKLIFDDDYTKKLIIEIEKEDFKEFDAKFDWLSDYKSYFLKKGYKEFDIMKYIAYMFFDASQPDSDNYKKDNLYLENHIKNVAKNIGEPVALIKLVTTELKNDAIKGDYQAIDIIEIISELAKEQKKGWKPIILRERT